MFPYCVLRLWSVVAKDNYVLPLAVATFTCNFSVLVEPLNRFVSIRATGIKCCRVLPRQVLTGHPLLVHIQEVCVISWPVSLAIM